jgi:hypothetical protein
MNGYKVCPNCGRQNQADAQWCASCGNSISNVAPPQDWQQPQQNNQAQSSYDQSQYQAPPGQYQQPPAYGQPQYQAPAPGYPQNAPMGGSKQQIANAIQMRTQTDEVMPVWWMLLPVIGIVVEVALGLTMGIIGTILGVVIVGVLFALLVYKFVNRQNEHLKREVVLRSAIINYFREKGREQYKDQMIAGQIATMDSINQEASYKEQENNTLLFTIMAFIPLLDFYVLYVLNKFPYEHDSRWHAFTQQAQYAAGQIGINIMTPSWKTLPRRSFLLYFILSIITGGIFGIYWLYTLINDPNEHYKAQWQFEDQLMSQLR